MSTFKTILLSLFFFFIFGLTTTLAYGTFIGPSGVIQWNKQKAEEGYVLFAVGTRTFLINMAGQIINEWDLPGPIQLLENGHVLSQTVDKGNGDTPAFVEQNWTGKIVWQYNESRPDYSPHHTFKRIYNQALNQETLLFIANKEITPQQALSAGADPTKTLPEDISLDAIVEIDLAGKVVWEWWFFDHLIQDIDPGKQNYVGAGKTIADYPGKLNINLPGKPLKRDWLHVNSIDYNSKLGQIVINSAHGEFYVIDHDNTFVVDNPKESIKLAASDKGDFLYRFGDPARYEQGEKPATLEDWNSLSLGHKQLGPSHSVSWIKEGYSGAGNFLVFNNANNLYQPVMVSSILEINPHLKSNKAPVKEYINPPDAGYKTITSSVAGRKDVDKQISNQVVWDFTPLKYGTFYSTAGSYAQRLKNGNTFACANQEGHFLEVDREGNVVWEYINPMVSEEKAVAFIDAQAGNSLPAGCGGKYSPDYPGLQGVDTTPGPTLLEKYGGIIQNSPYLNSIVTHLNNFKIQLLLAILLIGAGFVLGFSIRRKK
jgi:hypothetical protein